ncbi:hypothetical protein ACFW4X_07035 [Streptomyces smyrnaeus]|uniref:DUF2690 domain-containing protein n=1 Tax=Streptomyces smyrnaeus TaxID=1387713 RepID=A0ABS3XUH0_9ACTN|nr:hypothetical protein [Streptomyces smyrnaeus]MBO8198741.1 hypothetical protein [Streptomyces smyrnaeus]
MRTLSPVKGVLVTAACAMAMLPAGAAQAGDGAGLSPTSARAGEATATTAAPEEDAASRDSRAARMCSDAYQIGSTGYIKRKGYTIASVKQFYSPRCHRNYGYLYVWKGFRQHHKKYATNVGVYDFHAKKLLGLRVWRNTSAASFWSYPTNTVHHCTAARGAVTVPGEHKHYAYSSKRC